MKDDDEHRVWKVTDAAEVTIGEVVAGLFATSILILIAVAAVAAASFLQFAWFVRNEMGTFLLVAGAPSGLLLLVQFLRRKGVRMPRVFRR
ncbi:hypothetical protein PQQ96_23930 [Paraburkholderia sediminicola]|uniref:hypothetical protein n=1 Tax=Paraburkholderia sediminicola TaxID=458836 RepID=UPI0038B6ECBD